MLLILRALEFYAFDSTGNRVSYLVTWKARGIILVAWQRWNSATHIFELSTNEGASWIPLPLNGSIINEGTIGSGFVPAPANAALKNAANIFTVSPQDISAASPYLTLRDTSQGTDQKWWRVGNFGTLLYLQALTDVGANIANVTINRAGIVAAPGQIRTYVTAGAANSLPNNVVTLISFNTEQYDIGNCWAIGNPTAIIIPAGGDGTYIVVASVAFSNNSAGARFARISKNGVAIYQQYYPTFVGDQTLFEIFWITPMAAGDYFQLSLLQSSGSTLDGIGSGLLAFKLW